MKRVIVTCGPSWEPVDDVRRLTNFSTGELGVVLSEALAGAGYAVHCLKGDGAVWRDAGGGVATERFSTNEDLEAKLERLADPKVRAVFHAAALCDYRVAAIEASGEARWSGAKLDSRLEEVVLRLVPAKKLIGGLRRLFPGAWLVGWKYELEGGLAEAELRGWSQIREAGVDACVVNGRAVGEGFVVCGPLDGRTVLRSKPELAAWLAARLGEVA